jgi:hypothetical protein
MILKDTKGTKSIEGVAGIMVENFILSIFLNHKWDLGPLGSTMGRTLERPYFYFYFGQQGA